MITYEEAREKLNSKLVEWSRNVPGGLVIVDERTIAKSYGWIFFYNGSRFMKTGALEDAIGGNGPIIILVDSGDMVILGTAQRATDEVARFERAEVCELIG